MARRCRRPAASGIDRPCRAAVALRIFFTVILQYVLELPWLRLVGGLLLLWIAIKLLTQDEADEASIESSEIFGRSAHGRHRRHRHEPRQRAGVLLAAAHGNTMLIIFGLAISIPLIVAGATMIMALLTRLPILVWLARVCWAGSPAS